MFTLRSGLYSLLLMTLMALMLSGCYYDVAEELYPDAGPCDTTTYTYVGFVQPLVAGKCLGCHPDFSGYDAVKAKAAIIDDRVNRDINASGFMPKGGSKLDACDLRKFRLWIQQGYPQ